MSEEFRIRNMKRQYIATGDIILINEIRYICLYCDKLFTIIYKDCDINKFENVFMIPSADSYLLVGKATKEELQKAYDEFVIYGGLLKNRYLDSVERQVKEKILS